MEERKKERKKEKERGRERDKRSSTEEARWFALSTMKYSRFLFIKMVAA